MQADGTWEEKHCLLPIWHAPLGPNDASTHKPSDVAHVHVSDTGCLFPCKCVSCNCPRSSVNL